MGAVVDGIEASADIQASIAARGIEIRIVRVELDALVQSPENSKEIAGHQCCRRLGRILLAKVEPKLLRSRQLTPNLPQKRFRIVHCIELVDLQLEQLGPGRLEMRRFAKNLF